MSKEGTSAASLAAKLSNLEIETKQKVSSPIAPKAEKDNNVTTLGNNNLPASKTSVSTAQSIPQEVGMALPGNNNKQPIGQDTFWDVFLNTENRENPPEPILNSLYDPKYEEMGLPIDPHIRAFVLQEKEKRKESN